MAVKLEGSTTFMSNGDHYVIVSGRVFLHCVSKRASFVFAHNFDTCQPISMQYTAMLLYMLMEVEGTRQR